MKVTPRDVFCMAHRPHALHVDTHLAASGHGDESAASGMRYVKMDFLRIRPAGQSRLSMRIVFDRNATRRFAEILAEKPAQSDSRDYEPAPRLVEAELIGALPFVCREHRGQFLIRSEFAIQPYRPNVELTRR
jgi:hypothetical protein